VLQSTLLIDPNHNRSEIVFDALGLVAGIAVMGKSDETKGNSLDGFNPDLDEATLLAHIHDPLNDPYALLQGATARLLYDLFAYHRTQNDPEPQPAVVYTPARETHVADLAPGELTKIQHSFSYSDGFGHEIQKKAQAEPGPLIEGGPEMSPRWVGSGWLVFNNKGKPVRQFEPFFTDTHHFEFDARIGVSPILFYDPVQRVVATLHPNHTWEKVVFDSWRQAIWDVNDTVLEVDPKNAPDVGDFFRRLPEAEYLPTWYAQRQSGALGPQDQAAANKAAAHANTPTVAHFDPLRRAFLTVAHNKFKRRDTPPADPPTEELYRTQVFFDIEGNQREVIDARVRIHETSMDAGECWMLNDVAGKPIRAWDSRGHELRTAYDQLRRPLRQFVRGTDAIQSDPHVLNRDVLF
jgi:hypothetical protein